MANTVSRPIADILADYTATRNAINAILGGAQSGSMTSGAGATSFTAADYGKLCQQRDKLWDEYSDALDEQNYGSSYLSNTIFRRLH
jgi:hypothetical protein